MAFRSRTNYMNDSERAFNFNFREALPMVYEMTQMFIFKLSQFLHFIYDNRKLARCTV